MHEPMINLQNVNLSFKSQIGNTNVLNDINLKIMHGEATALIGPSGSGKSSLLMLIGGLERASSGKISIFNKNIENLSEKDMTLFRRNSIGVIFQSFHLIQTMTALENVMVPLEIIGKKNPQTLACEALESVGLSHRTSHYPVQLSGGEQQRVALARATATKPKLLLADEPTGNLDKASGDLVIKILFDLKNEIGSTLLIVTHSETLATKCDRQVFLSNGAISV